jgi:hypothetical protein
MTVFRRILASFIVLPLLVPAMAVAETPSPQSFRSPPASARPWTYWWWLNSNVTREGITRDLEEMHRQGIQGVLIFNAGGENTPAGPKFLSPEWNALFKFALSELSRLGMEASVNLCDGWDSGGPWIPAEAANKKLVWSETQVDGPRATSVALPLPPTLDNFYSDVAVLAIREKATRPVQPAEIRACSAVGGYADEKNWPPDDTADGDPNTFWRSAHAITPTSPAWIDFTYSEPLAASAIFLVGAKDAGPQQCALQTSDDGVSFTTLPVTWTMAKGESKRVEFPEVKAKVFRLVIQSSHTPDVQLAEMQLLRKGDEPFARPGIKWWQFKSGNRGFWDWPKQGPAVMEEEYPDDDASDCQSKEVVDLTAKMNDGKLDWQPPEGRWTILRFGYTLVGQRTRCSSAGSANVIGYEADMLDPLGIETHFKHCGQPLLDAAGQYAGKTLKYLHIDSYEVGADIQGQQPTWSAKFLDEFRTRRGYDPLPYLPAMVRRIVDNREKTDRFLWDMRMTVSDLMCDCFFKRFGELAHEHGVSMHCETGYGTYPHPQFDGLRAAGQCDVTMGEFWYGTDIMSQFYPFCNVIRSVASPAHIYGKKIVQAESFTAWSHFLEYPGGIKSLGDEAFCDGLNRVVFHQWTHQPNDDMPGYQYGAGTHIDRHVTWWNMSEPFLTYLTRCQYILQSGRFHADVCYLNAEGSSHYVPSKKYLKPALPPGYNFDCINADVLLNRMTVKDDRFVLPDATSYRLMVLPTQRKMSPQVLKKIQSLMTAGGVVVGDMPVHDPGLTNWPDFDGDVRQLADALRGKEADGINMIGRGGFLGGMTPGEALALGGTPPDFTAPNENQGFEFIHRILDSVDFYFVSNQTNEAKTGNFLFRVENRTAKLWDPVTGVVRALPEFSRTNDGRTKIPMTFAPHQSLFVVFKEATRPSEKGPAAGTAGSPHKSNFPTNEKISECTGPWNVSFDPKWGGPENVVFDKLDDWTKRPEEGIKYYSGTAVYRKTFDLDESTASAAKDKKPLYLDLGTVDYLARVRLNGKDLGILWTAPWRVDITDAVNAKGNELEIEVVNTWLNRLVGDARLPAEKRFAKTNIHFPANHRLMPSGLLGPVTVQTQSTDTAALHVDLPKDLRALPEPLPEGQKPGFAIRGIKGWYWTPEQYLEEIPVMAKYKLNFLMNCYTSMFSSHYPDAWVNEWWKPLPDDKKKGFAKVIQACKENDITFCFAVHSQLSSPRPLKPTSAEDIDQYFQNFAWAQSQGVKWFAVFLDDVNWGDQGPALGGQQHAAMVNTILSRLRAKDPEAQIVFCPVPYWGDGTPPDHRAYLEALGKDLNKDAYVVWTGDNVVSPKITRKAAESYRGIVKHRLFLFDNYPVNDSHPTMHLGPVLGRDRDLCEAVSVYMSNPMCPQNQINRIPLLTCADYAYNPNAYDPDRSIGQAIAHLAESDVQRSALRELVEAYPGTIRLGSQNTALNPVVEHFQKLLAGGEKAEAREYLRRMEDLAVRFEAAFPDQFADAKKTLRGNLEAMKSVVKKSEVDKAPK